MVTNRVVSLAPSATETIRALGAAHTLVGVTHACDLSACDEFDGGAPTVVGGWPNPDLDTVEAMSPDAVLTCDPLQRETATALRERGLPVTHAEPTRLADVYEYLQTVGDAVGRPDAGDRLAAECRERVERVRRAVPRPADGPDDTDTRPVVYAEEWGDPPMAAGNWVPDAVAAAGGRCPFVSPGERSRPVDPEEIRRADPAHVVLHWCGEDRIPDATTLEDRGWELDSQVHVVDDSLLNQPSPRLIDGIETLARLLHGVRVGADATT